MSITLSDGTMVLDQSDHIQAILDAAKPGDRFMLVPGVYVGGYHITVRDVKFVPYNLPPRPQLAKGRIEKESPPVWMTLWFIGIVATAAGFLILHVLRVLGWLE